MKKITWSFYIVIFGILTLLSVLNAFAVNTGVIFTVVSAALTVFYLFGVYGYVFEKVFLSRGIWRFFFWLNIVGILAKSLMFMLIQTTQAAVELGFVVVLTLPMIIALFKYSKSENPIWGNSDTDKKVEILSNHFETAPILTSTVYSETEDGKLQTDVSLEKNTSGYEVRISKLKNDDKNTFRNEFDDLGELIRFVEGNTPIRVGDFSAST